jgi:L-lactate dehydrogenase complex protein LldG
MSARREILSQVRAAVHAGLQIPAWEHTPSEENLIGRFSAAIEAAQGRVHLSGDLEGAWSVLNQLLKELAAKQIVISDQPPFNQVDLNAKLPGFGISVAAGDSEALRRMCLTADVAITAAEAGLADTGSVVIYSGVGLSRQVSLLPTVHVVILPVYLIVPDLLAWEAVRPEQMPSQVILISGPSKTADIEQTLVVGAHGPKSFEVILYGKT